jgi:hypothetical protein
MIDSKEPTRRGYLRISLIICLVFQAVILLTWGALGSGGLNPFLKSVGVVPLHVPFGDFRTISSGIQYYEKGGDPYTDGRYDFMGREFNYPPVWLNLSFLGVSPEAVSYIYFVFATLFSIALLFLFWKADHKGWYLSFLYILSPPVMLALERCNNDLLMFFLVVSGIWIGRKSVGGLNNWLCGVLVLFATFLKVFPVFAFYCLVRENWKLTLRLLIPFGIVSGVYFVSIKPILDLIKENTPWSLYLSFGVNVIPEYFAEKFSGVSLFQGSLLLIVAWVIAAVGIVFGYLKGRKGSQPNNDDDYDTTLFRTGGAIYIAVFLLGSSYDYRLMFLLLTLPFTFRSIFGKSEHSGFFRGYLGVMGVAYWVNEASFHYWSNGSLADVGLLVNEAANWGLFFMLLIAQFRLLPDFVRKVIYKDFVGS